MSVWQNNAAAQLRKDYEAKLLHLQEHCPHSTISEWITSYWAPGHQSGYDVQVCESCNKEVHHRFWCDACGKELIDDEKKEGNGSTHPFGASYCVECLAKPYDSMKRVERQTLSAWDLEQQKWEKEKHEHA